MWPVLDCLCSSIGVGWPLFFPSAKVMVDDLDGWWAHIVELSLAEEFGVQPPKAPAMQPWGLRTAYLYDPSGVLWHIAQRREGVPQD